MLKMMGRVLFSPIYRGRSKLCIVRSASTSNSDIKITQTSDQAMFVAVHPKCDFPYECTRPIPEVKLEEDTSVLKTQMTDELKEIFHRKTPEQARQELMNLTGTPLYAWLPLSRKERRRKPKPADREYL